MSEDENFAVLLRKNQQLQSLFDQVAAAKSQWERSMDCIEEMVIVADESRIVKRCNQSFKTFLKKTYRDIIGRDWLSLLHENSIHLHGIPPFKTFHKPSGKWFSVNENSYCDSDSGTVIIITDITHEKIFTEELEKKNRQIELNMEALRAKNVELEKAHADLQQSQMRIIHQEKMATIGQLTAGVAHEINNPIGFISSNLVTLQKYADRLVEYIDLQSKTMANCNEDSMNRLQEKRRSLKIEHIMDDVKALISESLEGVSRVRGIVQDLKTFSRPDEGDSTVVSINDCLESAINIVWNELKYKAFLKKDLGLVKPIRCHPRQLNQVFMNLLVNAAHSIEKQGEITVRTWQEPESVCASVSDTGCGIPENVLNRIFEPFFTTKEVGKGTGLGLSISYDIVKKHNGEILVVSEPGRGSTFTVRVPFAESADG